MGGFSKKEQEKLESAVTLDPTPIPMHCITNGERMPKIRQTGAQKKVAARLNEIADKHAAAQGLTRREFLNAPGPHKTDRGFRGAQERHAHAINELGPIHDFFVSTGGPIDFAPGSYSKGVILKKFSLIVIRKCLCSLVFCRSDIQSRGALFSR